MVTRQIGHIKDVGENHPMFGVLKQKMVDDANNLYRTNRTNISAKTVSKMAQEGRTGVSPSKLGPAGDFLKAA